MSFHETAANGQAIQPVWDSLLEYIDDGSVIPIVGAELLQIQHAGQSKPLYGYVAERLAERLLPPGEKLPQHPTLNDVVCQYLRRPAPRIGDVFAGVRAIMKEAAFEPPEVLKKLARIEPFTLFVTLTFDSLLKNAIDQVRFGGENRAVELAYSPGRADDLPKPKEQLRTPVVYHLFGKVSSAQEYVITDEDLLEFLYHLQAPPRRPNLLFDELKRNHLLFIGCDLSNWLARFFIRTAKSKQLSLQRPEMEVLVDHMAAQDGRLAVFLGHFSYGTRIIQRPAVEFITELEERYTTRLAKSGGSPRPSGPAPAARSDPSVPAGAVFISYASEDYDAASRLKDSLEGFNVEAWFDKAELQGGDRFATKIREGIKRCSCFIPVISTNSAERREGFFRREWRWAQDRAEAMDDAEQFIMPVVIDDTGQDAEGIPELLGELHWTSLQGGEATRQFANSVSRRQREYRKRTGR